MAPDSFLIRVRRSSLLCLFVVSKSFSDQMDPEICWINVMFEEAAINSELYAVLVSWWFFVGEKLNMVNVIVAAFIVTSTSVSIY